MPNPIADPFAESSDYRKFVREAKIGILLLLMLVGFFVYVVYYRVEQFKSQLPQYVLDAPVANLVEPDQYFRQLQPQVATAEQPAPNKMKTASSMLPPASEKQEKRTGIQPPDNNEFIASQPPTTSPEKKRSGNLSSLLSAFPFSNSKKTGSETKQVSAASDPTEYPVVAASANTPIELPNVTKPHRIERVKQAPDLRKPKQESLPQRQTAPQPEPPVITKRELVVPKPDQFTRELASVELPDNQPVATQSEFAPNSFSASEIHNMSPTSDVPKVAASKPNNDFEASFDTAGPNRLNSKSPLFEPAFEPTREEPTQSNFPDSVEVIVVDPEPSADAQNFIAPQMETKSPEPITEKPAKTDPMRSYFVKDGDSYWAIAQNVYGDGRYFRALFQHNRSQQVSFENLAPGTELFTPSVDILLVRYPELCPPDKVAASAKTGNGAADLEDSSLHSVYETASGETLFEIARRQLGQASRYLEILELNRENLPQKVTHLTKLGSGIQLQMPR